MTQDMSGLYKRKQEDGLEPLSDEELLKQYYSLKDTINQEKEKAGNTRLLAGLGEAFDEVGHSIARADSKPNTQFYRQMAANADEGLKAAQEQRKLLGDTFVQQRDAKKLEQGEKRLDLMEKQAQASIANSEYKHGKDDRGAVERAQKNLNSSTKDLQTSIAGFANVDKLADMAKTNPVAAAGVPIAMARALGEKGPLSDFDVKQWGGSRAVLDRLTRISTQAYSGTLNPKDADWMKTLASAMVVPAKERLAKIEDDYVQKHTANYGGTPDENYFKITGRQKAAPPPVAPGGAANWDASKEARLQELRSKLGKK